MICLGMLPHKAFVIFDRYDRVSAKVLESMRLAIPLMYQYIATY